ncbi:MAG: JmjC domain-containing protein [Candidatus Rokuibacteriota bacterium]
MISPLATWFADRGALARFRRERFGRRSLVVAPRDVAWRTLTPGFRRLRRLAASGVPVHVVAERRYRRRPSQRQLARAMAAGATVYLPQIHQVLPRVMRLMVALRATCLGPFREECSFLFLVEGRARPGMGLHHDGNVHGFWVQLEGRRTVTVGPAVRPGTPSDLDAERAQSARSEWWTRDLSPGTLLYLPPYTPHAVLCHGRSLALSLTWSAPRRRRAPVATAVVAALAEWDVASGQAEPRPRPSRSKLWAQVPAIAGPPDRARTTFPLWTPAGPLQLPGSTRRLARHLPTMPSLTRAEARRHGDGVAALVAHGILGDEDLPLLVVPQDPGGLDGWRF